jgi:para-nitrobenzyl esterase
VTWDQYKLYEAGKYNDTPVLIGTNSDEGASFVPSAKPSDYQNSTRSGFGEYADKILEAYPGGSDAEALRSSRDLARDTGFGWPAWAWARLQSKTGKGKVYVYYFSHRPPYPDAPQYKGWGRRMAPSCPMSSATSRRLYLRSEFCRRHRPPITHFPKR